MIALILWLIFISVPTILLIIHTYQGIKDIKKENKKKKK